MRQLSVPSVLLLLSACGSTHFDDVEARLGGFTFDPEQALFGPSHQAEFEAAGESTVPQAIVGPTQPQPATQQRWAVWAAWGHFLPTRDDPAVTTWSGSLSSDLGTLSLDRTLAFDRRDAVLAPPDDHTVAFVSHTRPHFDGLITTVDASSASHPVVTLQTPPITAPLALTGTPSLELLPVPDSTLHVAMISVPLQPSAPCATMVVTGRWRALEAARANRRVESRLVGRWFSPEGKVVGHWRAFMGHRRDGSEVFFGKVIDPQGNPLGLLRGTIQGDSVAVDILDAAEATVGHATLALPRGGANRLPVAALATQQACL